MSTTLHLVRDPQGVPYVCSVKSAEDALEMSLDKWIKGERRSNRPTLFVHNTGWDTINGYTVETLTMPTLEAA